jgi:hypothetical protein
VRCSVPAATQSVDEHMTNLKLTLYDGMGAVTWICPLGTHGLVYRDRPIMEMDKYKDSKIDLETKKEGSNTYSTRTLVKP